MSEKITFSCIIPSSKADLKSQKLQDLIASIKSQDFPQSQIEILIETEGDSEQAKANGIRKAKGSICAMFCADNFITENNLFSRIKNFFDASSEYGLYPIRYAYIPNDNSLNRYFSLIGGNDPICYYLGKNDRFSHVEELDRKSNYPWSYGCNGFFYRADKIKATDLDHYYPMDNALELKGKIHPINSFGIWHRTSDNLISFLKKRYRYARDLYSDRDDRRWKMLDTREDFIRLGYFVLSTLFILPCLAVSIRGFSKIRDWAWFWHWPTCVGFLITYTALAIRNLFKHGQFFQVKCPQSVS